MSLLDMIRTLDDADSDYSEEAELTLPVNHLRQDLYSQMSSTQIASLLTADAKRARREVKAVLVRILQAAAYRSLSDEQRSILLSEVLDLVVGLGPIEKLLQDQSITEVMVNGPKHIFFERNGMLSASSFSFQDEEQLRAVCDRIVGPLGRRLDESNPMVNARLATGHRVNVVIPPLAPDGTILTIRKFRDQLYTLEELARLGSMDSDVAAFLAKAVLDRLNIVVSGATASGKTTLLNALSVAIPESERIITIEDAAELRFQRHPHVVRLETRMRSAEGTGEVSIRDLVINSLRMRPDRIVVGECRGAEALDMLQAMNTGHDGSLTTLHANSPADVITRLVMMCRFGMDIPLSVIQGQIVSAFDLIVHLERQMDGQRRVVNIVRCDKNTVELKLHPIATWNSESESYFWPEQTNTGDEQ